MGPGAIVLSYRPVAMYYNTVSKVSTKGIVMVGYGNFPVATESPVAVEVTNFPCDASAKMALYLSAYRLQDQCLTISGLDYH